MVKQSCIVLLQTMAAINLSKNDLRSLPMHQRRRSKNQFKSTTWHLLLPLPLLCPFPWWHHRRRRLPGRSLYFNRHFKLSDHILVLSKSCKDGPLTLLMASAGLTNPSKTRTSYDPSQCLRHAPRRLRVCFICRNKHKIPWRLYIVILILKRSRVHYMRGDLIITVFIFIGLGSSSTFSPLPRLIVD